MINQILSHTSDSLFALNPHGLQPPLLFTICVPPQPHSCDSGGVTTAPEQTRGLLTESFTSSTESTSEKVRAEMIIPEVELKSTSAKKLPHLTEVKIQTFFAAVIVEMPC